MFRGEGKKLDREEKADAVKQVFEVMQSEKERPTVLLDLTGSDFDCIAPSTRR